MPPFSLMLRELLQVLPQSYICEAELAETILEAHVSECRADAELRGAKRSAANSAPTSRSVTGADIEA